MPGVRANGCSADAFARGPRSDLPALRAAGQNHLSSTDRETGSAPIASKRSRARQRGAGCALCCTEYDDAPAAALSALRQHACNAGATRVWYGTLLTTKYAEETGDALLRGTH